MKVNMDKIRQYEGSRKNIIQIGEYIMMWSLFGKKLIPNTFLHNI